MELKQYLPLAVATMAISATNVVCTAWLVHRLHIETPEVYSYTSELDDIQKSLDAISKNTESMDVRMMSPGERLDYDRMHPLVFPAQ